MQLDQIILRPAADLILLQHTDSAGRSGSTVIPPAALDAKQAEALTNFLALCRDRVPPEPDNPARAEVEQEIAELEYRLEQLRKSLEPAAVIEAGGLKL
jgi:hypothetical protein